MTKRDGWMDVYVTVPTREAKGSAAGDPCVPPAQSGCSHHENDKMSNSMANEIDITIQSRELSSGRASKRMSTRLESGSDVWKRELKSMPAGIGLGQAHGYVHFLATLVQWAARLHLCCAALWSFNED